MEPARSIIERLGGASAVAAALDLHISTVCKWYVPRGKTGGTGGLVPSQHIPKLVQFARDKGVFLEPNHFFEGYK